MRASIAAYVRAKRHGKSSSAGDRRGVTMLEYGLLAGLIALTCVTTLRLIAPRISNVLITIANAL